MALIPESFIDEVLQRTDIVELINSRVPLKRSGKNYSACCPFHDERTPSFSVVSNKQFYHCFGCGANGNAVSFVMEYDGVDFPAAIETLASMAGLEVPRKKMTREDVARQQQANTLTQLMERADLYYRSQLRSAQERQPAVNYLKNRGITGETAARFGLGFAPPGYDNLMEHLSLDNEGLNNAVTAGLLVRNEDSQRVYDKFRNRIIFPIRNRKGNTIAFGGRVLDDAKPKYLNSPETPLFHKSRELYGLHEWTQDKRSRDDKRVFVVEGYMDAIVMAQYDIPNVVATLGTATSEHHLVRLFNIVDEVVFCFDGDEAGQRAAWRAFETLLPVLNDGKDAKFLFLPDGEDPDSIVQKGGRENFLALVDNASSLADFLFNELSKDLDLSNVGERVRLAERCSPYIDKIEGDFYRQLLLRELAKITELTFDDIQAILAKRKIEQPAMAPMPPPPMPEDMPPPDYYEPSMAPPPFAEPEPPAATPRRRRSQGLSFLERLTIALLTEPAYLQHLELPEDVAQLDMEDMDVFMHVYQYIAEQPDIRSFELRGALLAEDFGEHIEHLLQQKDVLPLTETASIRFCHDAALKIQCESIDQAINREISSGKADLNKIKQWVAELDKLRRQGETPL